MVKNKTCLMRWDVEHYFTKINIYIWDISKINNEALIWDRVIFYQHLRIFYILKSMYKYLREIDL